MKMDITLREHKVQEDAEAAEYLARITGLSKSKIKDAMTKGAIWLNSNAGTRRLRRARHRLKESDRVSVYYSEKVLDTNPPVPSMANDCEEYSVWIKPVDLLSGGSRYGDHCTINRVVEKIMGRPTFLVHRLDRFVWGLMVLAHSKKAAADLSTQFQNRETRKVYKAVVHGVITDPCTISVPIDGKDAVSHIQPITQGCERSLIEVKIETGRKHQIRKHLASIGHPIVGDRQYGLPDEQGIQLASVALGFKNLDGIAVEYQLPKDLEPSLNS